MKNATTNNAELILKHNMHQYMHSIVFHAVLLQSDIFLKYFSDFEKTL